MIVQTAVVTDRQARVQHSFDSQCTQPSCALHVATLGILVQTDYGIDNSKTNMLCKSSVNSI